MDMTINGEVFETGEEIYNEFLRQYRRKEGMIPRGEQWARDQGFDTNAKLPQNYFDIMRSGVPEPNPGELTSGYRYDIEDGEGFKSPYVDRVAHAKDTDVATSKEQVRHDPEGLGFYYWLSSEVADAHSLGLIYRDMLRNGREWTTGDLVKHRVEGTATFNKFYDEGQTMNDMWYDKDVVARITKEDYDKALAYYKIITKT